MNYSLILAFLPIICQNTISGAIVRKVYLATEPPGKCSRVSQSGCPRELSAALNGWKALVRKVPEDSLAVFTTGEILEEAKIYKTRTNKEEFNCVQTELRVLLTKVYVPVNVYDALVKFNQSSGSLEAGGRRIPISNTNFTELWSEYRRQWPKLILWASTLCGAYHFYRAAFEPKVGQPIESVIKGKTVNLSVEALGTVVVPHESSAIAIIEEMQKRWKFEEFEDNWTNHAVDQILTETISNTNDGGVSYDRPCKKSRLGELQPPINGPSTNADPPNEYADFPTETRFVQTSGYMPNSTVDMGSSVNKPSDTTVEDYIVGDIDEPFFQSGCKRNEPPLEQVGSATDTDAGDDDNEDDLLLLLEEIRTYLG